MTYVMDLKTNYVVYGLRLITEERYRYVGMTIGEAISRLYGHRCSSSSGSKLAVHCWMRKYGNENIVMDILEECPKDDFNYIRYAERYWIRSLRELGHSLLNHTEGGEGVRGLTAWNKGIAVSEDIKINLRLKNLGKTLSDETKSRISDGVNRHFSVHGQRSVRDYWSEKYGEEKSTQMWDDVQRRKSRKMSGSGNPMYGRVGQDATCYGRVGELHPMYGKSHSDETKHKMSLATKGKPKSEVTKIRMSFANHTRHHSVKVNKKCRWCQGADLQSEIKRKETELSGKEMG